MPSYRFCRPDDIPLLVQTLNCCWDVHFPDAAATSATSFKCEIKEIDLWSSSCMIAYDGEIPIGVVAGCKRKSESLILRIGVNPNYLKKGHAKHLLESLAGKLTVLGPKRIVAEAPENNIALRELLKSVGYKETENYFSDYSLEDKMEKLSNTELFSSISYSDVVNNRALPKLSFENSWIRAKESLENLGAKLKGVSLVSVERVEGFILYREHQNTIDCLCFNGPTDENLEPTLSLLIRYLSSTLAKPICFPKICKEEVSYSWLEKMGFRRGEGYIRYELDL